MTPFQIITTILAGLCTVYYGPTLYRKDLKTTALGYLVWTTAVVLAVVSFVGLQ